jgi:hypothetical protein
MVYVHSAGAAAVAAMIQAVKASGVLVRVEPAEFAKLVAKEEAPLVVTSIGGFFTKKYQYLTSYKGLAFFTSSTAQLQLPYKAEIVAAGKIWMPQ